MKICKSCGMGFDDEDYEEDVKEQCTECYMSSDNSDDIITVRQFMTDLEKMIEEKKKKRDTKMRND